MSCAVDDPSGSAARSGASRRSGWTIFLLLLCAVSLRCGSRSELARPHDSEPASDSGADASSDTGQDAIGADTSVVDAAVPACQLKVLGEPVEVLALAGQDLHTPSVVVLTPADPSSGAPAKVALQAVGGDGIRLTALKLHQPTPLGTQIDSIDPLLVGGGLTYGQMVHAPEGIEQLALVWGADGPGNVFRTVDVASWSLGPLVPVAQYGWTPTGLAAGKGVPNTQTGQYDGPGYGMTWQGGTGESASVVVLSAKGEIQVGPLWTSAPVPSAQLETSIAWSGSTYLLATRFDKCESGDPLCRERAVVISRLRVSPGSNSVEFASSFEVATPGHKPGFPTLDGTFVVWDEGASPDAPRRVHLGALGSDGVPAAPDVVVASGVHPLARAFTGAAPSGRLVGWAEEGDLGLDDSELGRSRLKLQPLDGALGLAGAPLELAISRYGSMGHPVVVALEAPRGALVAWSARSRVSPQRTIFAQFLPCAE